MFLHILLFLLFLIIGKYHCLATWIFPELLIVNTDSDSKQFMLQGNIAREIPNEPTLKYLGLHPSKEKILTRKELDSFDLGPPIPDLVLKNESSDEHLRIWRLKVQTLQKELFFNKSVVCSPCKDPSAYIWNNKLLLIAEITDKRGWMTSFAWAKQNNSFYHSFFPNNNNNNTNNHNNNMSLHVDDEFYLGISSTFDDIGGVPVHGIDARVQIVNDDSILLFPFFNGSVFHVNITITTKHSLMHNSLRKKVNVYNNGPITYHGTNGFKANKNWTPFLYENHVLLIQQVNPLRIVEVIDLPDNKGVLVPTAKIVSEMKSVELPLQWPYGKSLRGGTNAVRIKNCCYLSFFHLKINYPSHFVDTVYFGAYTFSLEPPFRILSVSPYPIMDEVMYSGKWYTSKIDYVNYPMSIFLIDNGNTGVLTYCHNDITGIITKFNAHDLLDSLIDVQYE